MNTLESAFWRMIRQNTKQLEVHWERVENGVALGTPDLNGCHHGHELWIELKVAKGNKVNVSPEQVIWMHRRAKHLGKAWVLCRKLDDGDVIKAWPAHQAGEVRQNGWETPATYTWTREKNHFPWIEIVASLFA